VAVFPDGKRALSAGKDGAVKMWLLPADKAAQAPGK